MITPSQVSYLIAEILVAEEPAEVANLVLRGAKQIAELPPRERERAYKRIVDAARERLS